MEMNDRAMLMFAFGALRAVKEMTVVNSEGVEAVVTIIEKYIYKNKNEQKGENDGKHNDTNI